MPKKHILNCAKCADRYVEKFEGEKESVHPCSVCKKYYCRQHLYDHKNRGKRCRSPEDKQTDMGFPPAPVDSAPQHGKG